MIQGLKKCWIWPAIFLCVWLIGLYVRFYPARAHIWSDTTQQATVFVLANLKSMLTAQVNAQLPDVPQAQRNQLIEQRFAQTLHNESAMVKKTIAQAAQNLREQTTNAKDPLYLQEADGYYYLDLTKTILKTGSIAHEFKGSKYLNEKMAAPFGFWQPINAHPYVGLLVYKLIHLLRPQTDLVPALCYVGPILSTVALGAFILLCYILRLSPAATAIGSTYFYLAPIFVKRSTFAWYDDDSYNVIFPLLILCAVFQALKTVRTRRDGLIYGVLMAFLFAAYSLFWHGWGYTFGIVMISAVAILAADGFLERKFKPYEENPGNQMKLTVKPHLGLLFFIAAVATIVMVSLMFGLAGFIGIFQEGFTELRKFTTNQLSLWPNLFIAVGELKRSSLKEIMDMTGNAFSLCGAFLSVPFLGYIFYNRRDRAGLYGLIILTILLVVDLKITLGAERFILLCLIPLSVLLTMGLSQLIQTVRTLFHPIGAVPDRPNAIEFVAGLLLTAGLVVFPVRSINAQIPDLLNPIFNSTWEKALLDIKTKTPPDSIVTTWWPPGHFIKAIAERRVTFDGATLSKNKEAYWVANVFITSDERKAAGILRMLNTSGTQAVDYLESQGLPTSEAVSLLHAILGQSKTQAESILESVLPPPAAQKLLALTHAACPPSYLLNYSELMEKNIGLQFVGKWNFKAIEDLNRNPTALKELPPPNSPEFFEFLWKTMGGQYKYSEALIAIAKDGQRLSFDQGLTIDLSTMEATIKSPKYGQGVPLSIVYSDGSKIIEHMQPAHTLNYSVVLFQENTRYYGRLMDRELANSLLLKLTVFKGLGLELFKPLSLQSDLTGRDEVDVFELRRDRLQ